mgnify:CR=1 FL=1
MLFAQCTRHAWPIRSVLAALVLFLVGAFLPGHAHFQLNLNVRIFHVEHLSDGLRVLHRVPMPYLVAAMVGPEGDDGLPEPAPFTRNAMEQDTLMHYVAGDEFAANPLGLGEIAGSGLKITAAGRELAWRVEDVRIYAVGQQPDFASLAEARASFASDYTLPDPAARQYVGDTVVDVVLRYQNDGAVRRYQLSGTLDPGLPEQEKTANLVLDYGPGGDRVLRATGLLFEPLELSLIHISEPTRHICLSRMPSSA